MALLIWFLGWAHLNSDGKLGRAFWNVFCVVLCIYLFDYIHLCTCVASMCCVCIYIYIYIYACMYYVCMYYVCPFICMYIFIYALICMSNKIITIFIFIHCHSSSASFIIGRKVRTHILEHFNEDHASTNQQSSS